MTATLTLDEFRDRALKVHVGKGYTYPAQLFGGSHGRVVINCPVHGDYSQIGNDHLQGHGCSRCAAAGASLRALGRAEKHMSEVQAAFPDYDYSRFVSSFTKVTNPVELQCPIHGWFTKPVHKLKRGSGCQLCGAENTRISRLVSEAEFLSRAEAVHGDTYLYNNLGWKGFREYATITCQLHGDFQQKPESHTTLKHGCGKCASLMASNAARVTSTEFYSRLFDMYAGKYKYFNDFTAVCDEIRVECPTHGEFSQIAYVHLRGGGCPKCSNATRGVASRVTFDQFVEKSRELHGDMYRYLSSTYTDYQEKLTIVCPKHGEFDQKASDHTRGCRCPTCAGTVSMGQLQMSKYIESLGFKVVNDYRYGASKREVDVYVPEMKMAFEFDGIYFHSSKFKPSNYHLDKQTEVNANGITLVQVFSDEWETANSQIKNLIAARLGRLSDKIWARTCTVCELTDKEAQGFYAVNHVQGWRRYGHNLALKHTGEIVAVMTFTSSTSQRGAPSEEGVFELARFATSCHVVGAASKLFAHLVAKLKAMSVISYCDTRKFSGNLYKVLGFQYVHTTRPSYSYIQNGVFTRHHKSHFRKENLAARLGASYNANLSERENCEKAGYFQIYDCGLTKWQWSRKC